MASATIINLTDRIQEQFCLGEKCKINGTMERQESTAEELSLEDFFHERTTLGTQGFPLGAKGLVKKRVLSRTTGSPLSQSLTRFS